MKQNAAAGRDVWKKEKENGIRAYFGNASYEIPF
jgi:hypothetical protein